jgi:sugar phosphate permease
LPQATSSPHTFAAFILEPPTLHVLIVLFGLAGIHSGVQQSLEKSLAAEFLAQRIRGSGFGVLATVNGIGDLVSSIVVGALWSAVSPAAGFLYAAIFTGIGATLIYFFTPQPTVK